MTSPTLLNGVSVTSDKSGLAKWFRADLPSVPPAARELLEGYSHIPPDDVASHIVQVRNKAWDIHPFHCLGQFRFLELNLSARPELYGRVLARVRAGEYLLDVGCCLGQDVRKLVFDGAPAANVAGAELNAGFVDLGYELFRDRETLAPRFIAPANILRDENGALAAIAGQWDIVHLGMVLHLFTWEEQGKVFENAIALLRRDAKGTTIIGQAVGNLEGKMLARVGGGKETYRHNEETFNKLINEVAVRTGTQWKVTSALDKPLSIFDGKSTWGNAGARRLSFEIEHI